LNHLIEERQIHYNRVRASIIEDIRRVILPDLLTLRELLIHPAYNGFAKQAPEMVFELLEMIKAELSRRKI
jgi:hypothetical protein